FLKTALLRLEPGKLDHLAPLLGLLHEQLAIVGWRKRKRRVAEVGNPRSDPGIGKARADLLIELVDDLWRRIARRAEPLRPACLVARHEFSNRWELRQHRDARCGRHAERTQPATGDVAD